MENIFELNINLNTYGDTEAEKSLKKIVNKDIYLNYTYILLWF